MSQVEERAIAQALEDGELQICHRCCERIIDCGTNDAAIDDLHEDGFIRYGFALMFYGGMWVEPPLVVCEHCWETTDGHYDSKIDPPREENYGE